MGGRGGVPLTLADVGVSDVLLGVLVEERFALLTVVSHGVVLTLVTHASAHVAAGDVHRHVEVALGRVAVTVTLWREGERELQLHSG